MTITAHEPEKMEAAFNVTGERRKALVEAIKAFVDAPAVYQNAPSFAYVIGIRYNKLRKFQNRRNENSPQNKGQGRRHLVE